MDLDSVQDGLAGVVTKALEPAHVSVWINERKQVSFNQGTLTVGP